MPPDPPVYPLRVFVVYQVARQLATLAVQMQSVVVAWQVYEWTGAPLSLGLIGLAQFVPLMLTSLPAGELVDRLPRRHIMSACLGGFFLCALALARLAGGARGAVWSVYGVLACFGVVRAFFGPTSSALLPSLVTKAFLARAIALGSTLWQIATIVGPALGGWLYGVIGARSVFLASAGLLAVAALVSLTLPSVPAIGRTPGASVRARLAAGLRYLRGERVILGAISLDLFAVLLGGAVALLPALAHDVLHVGADGLGLLRAGPAMGAAAMALVVAWRPVRRRAGRVMLGTVAVFGLATCLFGVSRWFWLSLAALVVCGAADMVSVVIRQTLVQLRTPHEMRGRVGAVQMVFVGASNELGEFESGLTAAWLGTVPAVIVGGVGTLVVVALWARWFPALRDADRLTQG